MATQGKRIINAVTLVDVGIAIMGTRESVTGGYRAFFFCRDVAHPYWFPVKFGYIEIGWCCPICRERYRTEVRETAETMIKEARG